MLIEAVAGMVTTGLAGGAIRRGAMKRRGLLTGALLLLATAGVEVRAEPGQGDELTRTQEKLAELHEARDQLRAAFKIWRELLQEAPDRPRYLSAVARLALELQQPALALPAARRLVQLQPDNLRHRSQLVAALAALNREAEALPHLEILKQRSPNQVEVRQELVNAYQALRRPREALQQIDWLLARFPDHLEYRLTRADLLGELNRDAERQRELRALLPRLRGEQAAAVHRAIADDYLGEELYAEAERHLRAALAANPRDHRSRLLLVQLEGWRRDHTRRRRQARRDLERYQDWLQDAQEHSEDF